MRLKSVRIFGFKTFADRTEFNLDGGIVAVVGPNGCGKSNLVDAILWALGESNARHLRAQSSHDVIFSGSARRRAVGFAEVTLLFDNEDGALPIDTSEVAITRRLTRGGDSDFYINRRSCRQRDIHELLADSGLGRAGYSIVGQKEIDQALAASPLERRAWVDEAAGVQRYRVRKGESLKRLEAARTHLVRVDDILSELVGQREPLREEAEAARKYKSASDSLREIETGILIKELASASAEIGSLERLLAESSQVAREHASEIDRCEAETARLQSEIAEIEHRIDGVRSEIQAAISAIDRANASIQLGEERLHSLDTLENTLAASEGNDRVVEADHALNDAANEEKAERAALEAARLLVAGSGEEAAALSQRLSAAESELALARQGHAERLKRVAEQQHREERRVSIARELEGLEKDFPAMEEARRIASAECESATTALAEAEGRFKQGESRLVALREAEEAASRELHAQLAEKAALEGRKRGIESTIQSHEGLNQGSRALLQASERAELKAAMTPISAVLQTTREAAAAVEAILGTSSDDLIVEDEATATDAVRYLVRGKHGRATLRPRPLMKASPAAEVLAAPGVLGRARDLVTCDKQYAPLADLLLGSTTVVTDLETALQLSKSHAGGFVTLEGEYVDRSGAVTGGTAKAGHGQLRRKAELAEIDGEISSCDERAARLTAVVDQAREQIEGCKGQIGDSKRIADERRKELVEAERYLRALVSEIDAAQRSETKLRHEIDQLSKTLDLGDEVDVSKLQLARDAVMSELAGRSADASQARQRLMEADSRFQQAKARTATAARRLEQSRHSEHQRTLKLQNLEPERRKVREELAKAAIDREQATAQRQSSEAMLRSEQQRKDDALSRSIAAREAAKVTRAKLAAIGDTNHQAELGRARAESKRAVAAERLIDEYGITAADAEAQASSVEVPKDAQVLANRLRKELRAMGNVNLGAIEAFERLNFRCEELYEQRADILEGIDQVRAAIHELDALTRDRFMETFAKVQESYAKVFEKLFGGGEGKIFLDAPNAELDSGIEIEVTLPGKKRQRLELLSGGERALCATGFLFALLDVKPSPLVVLDEVDAPLDGRNVERFGDVLQEFTDRTQFIVITHNPTTIERAPIWLGVTMREPGVSTLIPARLPTTAVIEASTQEPSSSRAG